MTDVFISYKKEDVQRVRPIAEALAEAGYDVWWDHRIPPGRTYRDVIGAALNTAKCVIVVWSEQSVKSQWVLDEADAGQQRRILLPILIDNIMPPLGFTQIEAARLTGWTGDTSQNEWKHTVEAVAQMVGRAPGAAPPVSISMPSGGASAAMTRATPGAVQAVSDAKSGGGVGKALAALVALGLMGGGGYYAWSTGLIGGAGLSPPVEAPVETVPVPIEARVFLHISADDQRAAAEQAQAALQAAGHTVEGIENVGPDRSPAGGGEIRYFNDASLPHAEAAATALAGDGGRPAFRVRMIEGYPSVAEGQLEIYFQKVEVAPAPSPEPEPEPEPIDTGRDIRLTVKRILCVEADDEGPINTVDMRRFYIGARLPGAAGIAAEDTEVYNWRSDDSDGFDAGDVREVNQSIAFRLEPGFEEQVRLNANFLDNDDMGSDEVGIIDNLAVPIDRFGMEQSFDVRSEDFVFRVYYQFDAL